MKNPFIDKNDDWKIIKAVRLDMKTPKQGVMELFNLILSGHGQVGVMDGKIIYIPSQNYHTYYMKTSSSVIRMTDGNGSPMTNEMKLALLEEWQDWENDVISMNIAKINKALSKVPYKDRIMYLDCRMSKLLRSKIIQKHEKSKRQYYKIIGNIDNRIINEFKLYSDKQEEAALDYIIKNLQKYDEKSNKNTCQDFIEKSLMRRELIKTLYTVD